MALRKLISFIVMIIGLNCPIIVSVQAAEDALSSRAESTAPIVQTQARQLHVKTLAASCAACHGTLGNNAQQAKLASSEPLQLAGMNSTEFINALLAFKAGTRTATVMHHHAKGLTTQEISDLAEFFSEQVVKQPTKLGTQTLSRDHEN